MSNDPLKVDPLDQAGIVLADLSAEELLEQYKQSGAEEALRKHLAALESCRVNPESLRDVFIGPGLEE